MPAEFPAIVKKDNEIIIWATFKGDIEQLMKQIYMTHKKPTLTNLEFKDNIHTARFRV